jgi:hypothetical protein
VCVDVICEKTTTLAFLDLELVHHFDRKLVIQFSSFEVAVKLRLAVSRPVCFGVGIPSGAHDHISFIFLMIAGFLIWVCSLLVQLLLGLASGSHSSSFQSQSPSQKLYYDQQSVGQSVLVTAKHLGSAINFFPFSL